MKEKVWHDTDEFWETWQPFMFGENPDKKAETDVENIIRLLELESLKNLSVLDLCCGFGRHTIQIALQLNNIQQIVGVDRTKKYLDQAKGDAQSKNLNIEFVLDDMRNFIQKDSFDLIINLFTSFSFFEDPEEDKKVLENAFSSLKSGGRLLIEIMGKELLARIFKERDWSEKDGVFILEERKIAKNWTWMENRWIIIDKGEVKEYKVDHRLYSARELEILLKEVGFQKIKFYGDLKGRLYDQSAERLVVIATKT